MLAVPGAMAQAGNNVASGLLRKAMVATPGVSSWQAMWGALLIAFAATALVCVGLKRVYQGTSKSFTWNLPSGQVLALHELRLAIGLAATLLIFSSAQEAATSGNPPVALVTVLSSTGAISLAMHDLRRYRRFDGAALTVAQLLLTSLGFAGILIASWASLTSVQGFSWPVAASAVAGLLLGSLQLVQAELVKRGENSIRVVGFFAFQASFIAGLGYTVVSMQSGFNPGLTTDFTVGAVSLGVCYSLSQLLLQLANGFGTPSIVAVLVYLGIPTSYVLDFLVFHKAPNANQLVGGAVICFAACGIKLLEGQLSTRRPD